MLRKKLDKRKKKKGFTLIELLIVIAILAILGMILVPTIGSYRAKAQKSNIQASAKTLRNAIDAYNAENPDSTMVLDTATINITALSSASNDSAIDTAKLPGCLGGAETPAAGDTVTTIADLQKVVDGKFTVTKVAGYKSEIDLN